MKLFSNAEILKYKFRLKCQLLAKKLNDFGHYCNVIVIYAYVRIMILFGKKVK